MLVWNLGCCALMELANDGYLIFEANRALDTKDGFDIAIIDDSGVFTSNYNIFLDHGDHLLMCIIMIRTESKHQVFNYFRVM